MTGFPEWNLPDDGTFSGYLSRQQFGAPDVIE